MSGTTDVENGASAPFGLTQVTVRAFRSAREVVFVPARFWALVGEANAGKSNLLTAIWALLDPAARPLEPADAPSGAAGETAISATLAGGVELRLGEPQPDGTPPVLFLPASLRAGPLVAPAAPRDGAAGRALEFLGGILSEQAGPGHSATAPALTLAHAVEACCDEGLRGLVVLVEEPELYLRPQAQRYLYRLLRTFALQGNQVLYSTHAPSFLNVARLEELALIERDPRAGTRVVQPDPLPSEDDFRVSSAFDAERSELFLARAAVLVEGSTEKYALPFVFQALGHDPDREAISIVECGGKSKLPLFARVCAAVGVPFVVVHDRDAPRGREPIHAERVLNALISEVAGPERTVVLEPDFEGVAGLSSHSHKPQHAWRRFADLGSGEIPGPLCRVVELAVALARA